MDYEALDRMNNSKKLHKSRRQTNAISMGAHRVNESADKNKETEQASALTNQQQPRKISVKKLASQNMVDEALDSARSMQSTEKT